MKTEPTSLFSMAIAGGSAMVPLLIASIATWIVVLERAFFFWKAHRELTLFQSKALPTAARGDKGSLLELLRAERNSSYLGQIVGVAFERLQNPDLKIKQKWMEAADRKRREVNVELKRFLWILGTVATVTPFVGLFGTVVGILKSFRQMAVSGAGGFGVVASGISEALIATAGGILVAVIALLAYNIFQTKVSRAQFELQILVEEWIETLSIGFSGE